MSAACNVCGVTLTEADATPCDLDHGTCPLSAGVVTAPHTMAQEEGIGVADTSAALPGSVPNVPGPYWISIAANGAHQVLGRHGKIIRTYPASQEALASADCARLQAGHRKAIKTMRNAAQDLYEALENLLRCFEGAGGTRYPADDIARAALAKARGERL